MEKTEKLVQPCGLLEKIRIYDLFYDPSAEKIHDSSLLAAYGEGGNMMECTITCHPGGEQAIKGSGELDTKSEENSDGVIMRAFGFLLLFYVLK